MKVTIKDFNPIHTFDCGQCFRWNRQPDESYIGVASSDISTGEFKTTYFNHLKSTLIDEITKISPIG